MPNANNSVKLETMAAYEGQRAAKRRAHTQDTEHRQKHLKTNINDSDSDSPETSSPEIPNEKQTASLANDEISNEVADILQCMRSETNRPPRNRPRSSRAGQPLPGPLLSTFPTYGAPPWIKSQHTGLFEQVDDKMPKPTEMDWTIPQRKYDSQGRGYYYSGKMNGNRQIWRRDSSEWLEWSPRELSADEAKEEIGKTFPFADGALDEENNAVIENGAAGKDESCGKETRQRADSEDTENTVCGELERKWMATGNFWED